MNVTNILKIDSWEVWENLLIKAEEYTFLQSWQFGELQKSMGNGVERLVGEVDSEPVVMAQLLFIPARRGKVCHLRHAPTFLPRFYELGAGEQKEIVNEFLKWLVDAAKSEKCDFIRLQALVKAESDHPLFAGLKQFKFAPANIHNIDAQKTLILDISKSEEELQQQMRKQTRYYARKAEKMGVEVEFHEDMEALDKFYEIHHDTTVRQNFKSYSHKYYQESLEFTNSIPESKLKAKVLLAKYEGKYIAGAIIVFFGRKAYYSDGGSLSEYNKIPASYLIQWKAIQKAKELGAESYNFWGGISPDREDTNYPWYGIDLFKRGFGGERVDFMHAHDLGLTPKYQLTRLWEKIEKWRRGY